MTEYWGIRSFKVRFVMDIIHYLKHFYGLQLISKFGLLKVCESEVNPSNMGKSTSYLIPQQEIPKIQEITVIKCINCT